MFILKNLYNKHKTHIIYSFELNSKKIIFILLLVTFNTSFWFTFKTVERNFKPSVNALATANAGININSVINNSIKEITKPEPDYSKICQINKNDNGEIISITTNTRVINEFKLKLSEKIIKNINKNLYQEHGIPIGNLTNTYILSGRGPKIPVKILTASSPNISVESKFESTGINQTKHKISVITNIDIRIILPYETLTKTVTTESLLCETIIVGKVPNVYISK